MNFKIKYLLILLIPYLGTAQSSDNSVFSRFGLGDFAKGQRVSALGMGGLKVAYNDAYNTNFDNPASLTALKAATYEGGIYAKYSSVSQNDKKASFWSGNLSYLSIAFPLKNQITESLQKAPDKYHYSLGLNLAPFSTVNYNIVENRAYPGIDTTINTYNGSGAIYKMQLGSAFAYKNFSVGLNIGWLFGKITNYRQLDFNNVDIAYSDFFNDAFSVNGFNWHAGLLYTFDWSKGKDKKEIIHPARAFTIGLTGHTAQSFNTNKSYLYRRINNFLQGGNSNTVDTFYIGNTPLEGVKGKGRLPAEIGLGFQFVESVRLKAGMDVTYADWSSYKNDAKPDSSLVNFKSSIKLAAGIEYCPNPDDYKYYYRKIRYRFGVYYEQDPREISGVQLSNYGLSIGFGMPIKLPRQQTSFVHWAIEAGQFSGSNNIKESYVRLHFGFTFNDSSWFYKRRFD